MTIPRLKYTWNGVDYEVNPLDEIRVDDGNKGTPLYVFLGMPRKQADYIYYTWLAQMYRYDAYPDLVGYVDGVVKADQAQIDAYITACQAVKQQFPKPTMYPTDDKDYEWNTQSQSWVEIYAGNS